VHKGTRSLQGENCYRDELLFSCVKSRSCLLLLRLAVFRFLSPSHDRYVAKKLAVLGVSSISFEHRYDAHIRMRIALACLTFHGATYSRAMIELATRATSWLGVWSWEGTQTEFVNFDKVALELEAQLRPIAQRRGKRIKVAFVCGADHARKHRLHVNTREMWRVVTIGRGGADVAALRAEQSRWAPRFQLVDDVAPLPASSTGVRQLLMSGSSLSAVVPGVVQQYITDHHLTVQPSATVRQRMTQTEGAQSAQSVRSSSSTVATRNGDARTSTTVTRQILSTDDVSRKRARDDDDDADDDDNAAKYRRNDDGVINSRRVLSDADSNKGIGSRANVGSTRGDYFSVDNNVVAVTATRDVMLIGIAGVTRSGKSTLADSLCAALGISTRFVIHQDKSWKVSFC
jgi:nicotinic acid mononucleotide adenylyltransferase